MKNKNNVYVEVESEEQAETYRKVLEAIGTRMFGYYSDKNLHKYLRCDYNGRITYQSTNLGFEKITFGELIDLLQRKPLLISENGVPLYEGDEFCFVNKLDFEIDLFMSEKMYKLDSKSTPENTIHKNHLLFSTKQAALEWIEAQKPKSITVELFTLQVNAICTSDKVTIKDLDEEFSVVISKEKLAEIYKAMEELQNA